MIFSISISQILHGGILKLKNCFLRRGAKFATPTYLSGMRIILS